LSFAGTFNLVIRFAYLWSAALVFYIRNISSHLYVGTSFHIVFMLKSI